VDGGVIVGDTDAFVDLLRGAGAHRMLEKLLARGRLATTAVTVFEIWRGLASRLLATWPGGSFAESGSIRSPMLRLGGRPRSMSSSDVTRSGNETR
jgi:hypothetical protein